MSIFRKNKNKRKQLQSVDLYFENCEECRVPVENIEYLCLNNITKQIKHYNFSNYSELLIAKEVYMEINGDVTYIPFGLKEMGEETLSKRILLNDITEITLNFTDGSHNTYWVDYDGEEQNKNQISIVKNNYIKIQIKEGNKNGIETSN